MAVSNKERQKLEKNAPIDIVGGSGFIGSTLTRTLLSEGYTNIRIIDLRESAIYPEMFVKADIRRVRSLAEAIRKNSTIFHLAAVHRDDVKPSSEYYRTNVQGTQNVIAVAEKLEASQIIFTSSVAVYGLGTRYTEESPPSPFNHYGTSKLEAEHRLLQWHHQDRDHRKLTIVRPTVVFGEGNRGNVYNLARALSRRRFIMIGDGENKKSLAYVDNIAAYLCFVMNRSHDHLLANYSDTPTLTLNQICYIIRSAGKLRKKPFLRLPRALGLVGGFLADAVSFFLQCNFPVSRVRVLKLTASTVYESMHSFTDYSPPVPLAEALGKTAAKDYLIH